MPLLNKLERLLRPYAVPNVTLLLAIAQVAGFLLLMADENKLEKLTLSGASLMDGEYWRLVTFLFYPCSTNVLFLFFGVYLFYLMGNALEAQWGPFRYNVYLIIAYLATVLGAFLAPHQAATNVLIGSSVFLAFAYLYPDFQLMLFFILPVKIKYLAMFTWIGYVIAFATGETITRVMIVAGVSNFLLFFGRDIVRSGRDRKRGMERKFRQTAAKRDKPFHCCAICGATERSHPKMDFRYCTQCSGSFEYCADHLRNHEHAPLGGQPVEIAKTHDAETSP